ncbi:hypothetical protein [Burkholderia pseudomallei]|uniref:hypothetical protein n=1 Tax=Burkholderia pseudomallei TaxID=28450 RepID=UPI00048A9137|nr:hypothetical protein [Burkholderia pseudomallei]AIP11256.1 hypothetical protein DP55_2219 [Burkholderia pseudomallei]AJX77510.1 putative exported protein [Burkholderia pseudomallei MSHR2543]AJX94625.1 putative exported protein [Burkholderia pseudomallei PB08298010]KGS33935.1 putative exported protein [Burkholderia pseudomallei MSHR5569]KGU96027.1 hypothetical protein X885_879 [Burkholderia pseudomallei MSHR4372]
MLRWLISILFLANMLAFVVVRGVFGPLPAAGPREPGHALLQVRPDALRVTPVSQAADQPIVGGPIVPPALETAPLNAPGAAPAAASDSAPGSPAASAPASMPASVAAPAAPAPSSPPAAQPARAPILPGASAAR